MGVDINLGTIWLKLPKIYAEPRRSHQDNIDLQAAQQWRMLRPNPPFLRNRRQADSFSGEERSLAVVEVPADRYAHEIVLF